MRALSFQAPAWPCPYAVRDPRLYQHGLGLQALASQAPRLCPCELSLIRQIEAEGCMCMLLDVRWLPSQASARLCPCTLSLIRWTEFRGCNRDSLSGWCHPRRLLSVAPAAQHDRRNKGRKKVTAGRLECLGRRSDVKAAYFSYQLL